MVEWETPTLKLIRWTYMLSQPWTHSSPLQNRCSMLWFLLQLWVQRWTVSIPWCSPHWREPSCHLEFFPLRRWKLTIVEIWRWNQPKKNGKGSANWTCRLGSFWAQWWQWFVCLLQPAFLWLNDGKAFNAREQAVCPEPGMSIAF